MKAHHRHLHQIKTTTVLPRSKPTEAPELSSGYDGPPWVFTWDVDDGANQYTVILTINETSTSYTWSVTVDGVLEGVTLDNFV